MTTTEACKLAGITRMTLWRWIYEDGLPFWRDPRAPHAYYYRPIDLQRIKVQRGRRRIALPKLDEDAYDYG